MQKSHLKCVFYKLPHLSWQILYHTLPFRVNAIRKTISYYFSYYFRLSFIILLSYYFLSYFYCTFVLLLKLIGTTRITCRVRGDKGKVVEMRETNPCASSTRAQCQGAIKMLLLLRLNKGSSGLHRLEVEVQQVRLARADGLL